MTFTALIARLRARSVCCFSSRRFAACAGGGSWAEWRMAPPHSYSSCAAVCALLIGTNLRTYQRLSFEQPAGELQFARVGDARIQRSLDLSRAASTRISRCAVMNGRSMPGCSNGMPLPICSDSTPPIDWSASAAATRASRTNARQPRTVYDLNSAGPHRSLGFGAPLPLVDAVDGCTVRQRDLPAHGGRRAV